MNQELAELPKVNGHTNDRVLVIFRPIERLSYLNAEFAEMTRATRLALITEL